MKKILLLCMLSFVTIMASAQLTYDFNKKTGVLTIGGDGTTVTENDVTKAIRRYAGQLNYTLKEVVFTANGVTMIGEFAFYRCESLTSITLPDGVTTIGDEAFSYCKSLTSIALPDGLTTIGDYAFSNCYSLTSITLPDRLTTIGEGTFQSCESLTNITIPDGTTTIGEDAFYDCRSLTNITLPNTLTTIGDGALSNCKSLISIALPDGVTTIGNGAFFGCRSLTSIAVSSKNTYFASIEGVLFDKQKKVLLIYPAGRKGSSYIVPKGTENIGNKAFNRCYSLTKITFPDGLTTIDQSAFWDCSSLTNITLPNTLTTIGDGAFLSCRSLTSITLPDGLITIGNDAFTGCSFTNITLPDGLTSIGNRAFYLCTSLTSITLPGGLTTIGEGAFDGCESLTDITCLSATEPQIGAWAFANGGRNRTVYVPNATSGFTASNWGDSYTTATIKYGKYPTGIQESIATSGFSTRAVNGSLFIEGLKPGTAYTVMGTNGSLIAKGIATAGSCQVKVSGRGICIIHAAGISRKVVYE